jgi:hypothetical protein
MAAGIFLLWFAAGCKKDRATEQQSQQPQKPAPAQGTAKEAPPATYLPVGEASLREFDSGSEYVVSGKITTELMEPVAGATVSAYGSPPYWTPPSFEQPAPLDTQTCDDAGAYQVRLKLPANLWIMVKMQGYAPIVSFLQVRDTRVAVRDYQLRPTGATVSGIVSDKKDLPVAGVMVIANTPPFTLLADSVVFLPKAQVTDSAGKYTIEDLPEGDVSLVATARGYAEQEELSPLRKGNNDLVNFSMPAATPISVAVKNSRGEALPYATAAAPGFFKIAGADKRGVIEFSIPLEIGPFDCTVAAEGYRSRTIQLDPKSPPASVMLDDRPVIKGKVISETGEAVAGALVTILGTGGAQGKFDAAIQTDGKGMFALSLTYPPMREIRISRLGFFDQRVSFDKGKEPPADFAIRLKRVEAGIFGRVIDYRGIPVKRFVIHLKNNQAGGKGYQRSFSTGNGKYAVTDVTPGVYELIIQSVAGSTAEDVQLWRMDQMEIRKGFLIGEVMSQFPKPKFVK